MKTKVIITGTESDVAKAVTAIEKIERQAEKVSLMPEDRKVSMEKEYGLSMFLSDIQEKGTIQAKTIMYFSSNIMQEKMIADKDATTFAPRLAQIDA